MRLWLRVHVLFVPGCFQPSRGWIERDGADGGPQIGATFLCCAFLSVTYLKHELLGCHGWPCKAHLWLCYKGVDGGTNARKKGFVLPCFALRFTKTKMKIKDFQRFARAVDGFLRAGLFIVVLQGLVLRGGASAGSSYVAR